VVLDERVAALHLAIGESDEPAVLVAHSAGCIVTAFWAARHTGPVKAALLVAPPFVPDLDVPRGPFPFPTMVVASRTDPWCTYEESERYARDWGAELYDAGDAGHIETASGYGPWPEGWQLVGRLAEV
jgi:predicted alpha/beta hydrolase family esterase